MNANIAKLIAQLEGNDTAQQTAAATELATLGYDAQPAAVALVRTLGIPDDDVLEACTAALEELGPPAADQIPAIAAMAGDCSSDVAYWSVTLLGRAGNNAASAIPALVQVLQSDADLPVRERAAWALGEIGPAAGLAASILQEAARSKEPRLARLAAKALEAVGG